MNTTVSFEIAKLLKEKGFDMRTNSWYNKGDNTIPRRERKLDNYNKMGGLYISAPSIGEVIDWMYAKKDVWIAVFKVETNSKKVFFNYEIYGSDMVKRYFGDGLETPTETYSTAILYALNSLI